MATITDWFGAGKKKKNMTCESLQFPKMEKNGILQKEVETFMSSDELITKPTNPFDNLRIEQRQQGVLILNIKELK